MDTHYNAFISYRHHPEDIRVATEVHRALERYHIPKAVRKNQKGPLRLFRDKDELPITSNLSDDITLALQNSDYLIVICSTHTKESLWVQREIETFLKTHSYDKVLTVLVDGEPYDTIPEILQYRDETDPETGTVTRVPIEPLSCDWRLGKKAAYREELPRLAAALLHCGYDELRQRQRQYKMRRLMTILSAATVASLCLTAYFLYTSILIQQANDDLHAANVEISKANEEIRQANVQIQANLDEALRNQSQYLSSAASERYLAGDRLTAISLALAALPSQEDPRPYVPAAELTLADALGIYEPNRGIIASGIIDCGALIDDFAVSADGKLLYAVDRADRVTVWDTGTYSQLASIDLGSFTNMNTKMLVADENLILQYSDSTGFSGPKLHCYSPQGVLLWSVESCTDFAMLGDETLMVMNYDILTGASVSFLDPVSGSSLRPDVEISVPSGISPRGFYQSRYESGSLVTLKFTGWDEAYVYVLDAQTGTVEVIDLYAHWDPAQVSSLQVLAVSATSQGDILAMISDGSGGMNGEYNDMVVTGPANAAVLCFRGDGWGLAWQQQISSYSYSALRTMQTIPGTDRIFCQKDNVFYILDSATGQVLSHCETQANARSVYVEADNAYGVLENGCYFRYDYADGQCRALQLMDADILRAEVANAYFTLVVNSSHITVYDRAADTQWTPFSENANGYVRWSQTQGDRLVTLHSRGAVQVYDMQADRCLWVGSVNSAYSAEFLGFSADGDTLYIKDGDNVLAFAMDSGEMRTMTVPETIDGQNASTCGYGCAAWDRYHYLLRMEDDLFLAVMDLNTGEATVYPLRQDIEGSAWAIGSNSCVAAANAGCAWVWDEGTLYEFTVQSGALRPILTGLSEYPLCTWHEDEALLSAGVGNEIIFFQPGGDETMRISMGQEKAASLRFYDGALLVVSNEGALLRFGMDGTRLSKTELHLYTTFYTNSIPTPGKRMNINWSFTSGSDLILDVFGLGNIIDCTHWDVRAYVLNYTAYHAQSDRLICCIESQLGSFPRYSTDQVMQIAREQLGGYTLSDEQKAYYGIG